MEQPERKFESKEEELDDDSSPIAFRTRSLKRSSKLVMIDDSESEPQEDPYDVCGIDDDTDLPGFIAPDDDVNRHLHPKVRTRNCTLKNLLRSAEDDIHRCPFPSSTTTGIRTTRPEVVAPSRMITFRLPETIFTGPTKEAMEFQEKDSQLIKEFEIVAATLRPDWGTTAFYKKFYNAVIINAGTLGRASRASDNANLLNLIMGNRIIFTENLVMDDAKRGKCDGCGCDRILSYLFFTFDGIGNQTDMLRMGNHCGEKIRCLIEAFRILNSLPFISLNRPDWLMNAQTMFNYWSYHALTAVSDPKWRVVEVEEQDNVDETL